MGHSAFTSSVAHLYYFALIYISGKFAYHISAFLLCSFKHSNFVPHIFQTFSNITEPK